MTASEPHRLMAYIDGFTVYYGLREKGWKHLYWLDYRSLIDRFALDGQVIVGVKYFTSRVTKPADSRKRQTTYLEAIAAWGGVETIEGNRGAPAPLPQLRPPVAPPEGEDD